MSTKTTIEWTKNDDGSAGRTWNVVTGCDKVSPGCDHCYAENIARRFAGGPGFPNGFAVTVHPERLLAPLRWRKPTRVFVNSMSDMFHAGIGEELIAKMFAVMAATPQHTYQILTKRHARMRSLLTSAAFVERFEIEFLDLTVNRFPALAQDRWSWPLPNIHLGVSCEDQKWADIRIPALLATPAAVRFLSCEPLLSGIDLDQFLRGDDHDACRSGGPRPSDSRILGNRPGGPDLENAGDDRRIGDWGSGSALQSEAGGYGSVGNGRLPQGSSAGGERATRGASASDRLDVREPKAYPDGVRSESQERGEARQPTGESGTDDARRERPARATSARALREVTEREAVARAGNPDPAPERQLARVQGERGGDIRCQHGHGSQHRVAAELEVGPRIHWLIAGAESGPGARPMDLDWVRSLRDQCVATGTAFFFKQAAVKGKKVPTPELDGRVWVEMPQMPEAVPDAVTV